MPFLCAYNNRGIIQGGEKKLLKAGALLIFTFLFLPYEHSRFYYRRHF